MRTRQSRGQSGGGALPAMTGDGPLSTLSGSAGYDSGKQCSGEAQHRLLRMMVSVPDQYIGARRARQPPAAAMLKYG
jgi:hypothetical protein